MADTVLASGSSSAMDDLPLWLQPTGGDPALNYTANADRLLMDAVFATEGPVGPGTPFLVTQRGAGANFSVDVSAGYAVIIGDSTASQGKYLVHTTGTVNLATPTAPASGTRIHRVIARIRDKASAGTNYDWTLEVLEDTGTGTPTQPASAITLATVSIAAGQASVLTANITTSRRYASVNGGEIWVASQADRDALTPSAGQQIWRTDKFWGERYNGTKWIRDPVTLGASVASWTNNTTQSAIGGLSFPVEANHTYTVEFFLVVFGASNTGLVFGFTFPAAATLDLHYEGWNDGNGIYNVPIASAASSPFVSSIGFGYNGSVNISNIIGVGTFAIGANAGTVQMTGAQRLSTAVTSQVYSTSWLRYAQSA